MLSPCTVPRVALLTHYLLICFPASKEAGSSFFITACSHGFLTSLVLIWWRRPLNVPREYKNICNIFMLNHIAIQIGLQSQICMPSCVFWLFLIAFCVMRKPGYMAYFTDSWFCCFVVLLSSVKRLHDRIFHPWMSFWSHLYFRGIYNFLCARLQHKLFMKLLEKLS